VGHVLLSLVKLEVGLHLEDVLAHELDALFLFGVDGLEDVHFGVYCF